MVPSWVANRKTAGVFVFPGTRSKASDGPDDRGFWTIPVGDDGPLWPTGRGIVTTRGCGWPAPSYMVATPVVLSVTHQGPVEAWATPQGPLRLPSVFAAGTAPSE